MTWARGTRRDAAITLSLGTIVVLAIGGLSQPVTDVGQGTLDWGCTEADGFVSVESMQRCVETLQSYAAAAQEHASRSISANADYASNFHSAMLLVERLEGERAKHEKMFKDVSADQKKRFDGLFERLGAVSGTLESLKGGRKKEDASTLELPESLNHNLVHIEGKLRERPHEDASEHASKELQTQHVGAPHHAYLQHSSVSKPHHVVVSGTGRLQSVPVAKKAETGLAELGSQGLAPVAEHVEPLGFTVEDDMGDY